MKICANVKKNDICRNRVWNFMQNFAKFRLKFVFFDENHKNDHFSIASNRHLNFINGLVDQYIVLSDENWRNLILLIMLIIYHSADFGKSLMRYFKMLFKRFIKDSSQLFLLLLHDVSYSVKLNLKHCDWIIWWISCHMRWKFARFSHVNNIDNLSFRWLKTMFGEIF